MRSWTDFKKKMIDFLALTLALLFAIIILLRCKAEDGLEGGGGPGRETLNREGRAVFGPGGGSLLSFLDHRDNTADVRLLRV